MQAPKPDVLDKTLKNKEMTAEQVKEEEEAKDTEPDE